MCRTVAPKIPFHKDFVFQGNLNVRIQIWDANLFSADKVIDETNWTYSGTTNIHLAEVSLVGNRQKARYRF